MFFFESWTVVSDDFGQESVDSFDEISPYYDTLVRELYFELKWNILPITS